MPTETGREYDADFFAEIGTGSSASAAEVVPLLIELVSPGSVLDVGCGTGRWLAAWCDESVTDLVGVDGDYVDRTSLAVPATMFHAHDLTLPLDLGRRFDVVTCLEVAEHIPRRCEAQLIDSLVRHADVVVFSAAIPAQGGHGHINERWLSHWVSAFNERGFELVDALRPRLWTNENVEYWYRQNLVIFANDEGMKRVSAPRSSGAMVDVVHPELYKRRAERSAKQLVGDLLATTAPGLALMRRVSSDRG